jgi:hypothetical protein
MPDPQTQTVDLAELAKKYGGKPVAQGAKPSVDLTALAAKYGGKSVSNQAKPASQGPAPSSTSNPIPPYQGGYAGFTPGHMASNAGQGIKNIVQGITGTGPKGEGSLVEIGANIEKHLPEMGQQSEEIRSQAKAAFKRGGVSGDIEGYTKGVLSQIPMLGPWLNDKYNQAMSGDVGGSLAETATTAALAKVIDTVNEKGPNAARDIKNAFPKHVIVGVSNLALDHIKDGQVGDAIIEGSRDTSKLGQAIQATKDRNGAKYSSVNTADKIKDPGGFRQPQEGLNEVDKAVADKGAEALLQKKMLSNVSKIRALYENRKGNLSFNDIKQIRTFIGQYRDVSKGVENSILGDLYASHSNTLIKRAKELGPDHVKEYLEANADTENLKNHQDGIITELKSKKTGLQYFNEITKESNQGRLTKLENDLHLPTGYFADTARNFRPLHRLAALTEGSSTTGLKGSRISAFMRHPIGSSAGIGVGGAVGGAAGMLAGGHAMVGSIMGMTAAAMKVDDFINRYDAAKKIREMGGPDNVTGRGQATPSRASSQQGPGGGGSSSPMHPPVMPPGSPLLGSGTPLAANTVNPKLQKLLAPGWVQEAKGVLKDTKIEEGLKAKIAENESIKKGEAPLPGQGSNAFDKPDTRAKAPETKTEPKVTKAPPEARGRVESVRKGMTKDTPEARNAKAAERIAKNREEATRTQIKGSLEDQARQVAGKMDFQGKSNIELEEGLQTLFGDNGKRFVKQFQALAKKQKWSDDVYRGYLEDTIDRRVKELASKPAIPGLNSVVKN